MYYRSREAELANNHFDLTVYAVAKAEEKTEYAKDGAILIDDRPSSVVRFNNATSLSGGLIWPAEYNAGLDEDWYFDVSLSLLFKPIRYKTFSSQR